LISNMFSPETNVDRYDEAIDYLLDKEWELPVASNVVKATHHYGTIPRNDNEILFFGKHIPQSEKNIEMHEAHTSADDAPRHNSQGFRILFGEEIPREDEKNIVLAVRTEVHGPLPEGNRKFEKVINEYIKERDLRKVEANDIREVLRRLDVAPNNEDEGFTSSSNFWAIVDEPKPGKDWQKKKFAPARKYKVLYDKTRSSMKTRVRKNSEMDTQENKRKRIALEDERKMPASQYQVPRQEDFGSLLEEVQSCQLIQDFCRMYDSGIVYICLNRIRTDLKRSGQNVETWAKEWAKRLFQNDEDAENLHRDRKLCLELVYTLCNRWKGVKAEKTLEAKDIVTHFGDKRVLGILGLCLPMDRACALYNLSLPGEVRPGVHWVSEIHVARDPQWAQRMNRYTGRPTMNKRFLWLMEDQELAGLNLRQNDFLCEYTTPVETL